MNVMVLIDQYRMWKLSEKCASSREVSYEIIIKKRVFSTSREDGCIRLVPASLLFFVPPAIERLGTFDYK